MTTLPHPLYSSFDNSFSIHLSRTYNLSILLGRDRFSFCFNRHDDNCLIGLESYGFSISNTQLSSQNDALEWCKELSILLESLDALKKPFHKVGIAVECHKSTLIPGELFSEGNQNELLLFNQPVEEFEFYRHEQIPKLEAELIYAIPSCIVSALHSIFPETEISNASGQMIETLLKTSHEPVGDGNLY